jgi:predicted alpha-1,6-mannanase (GH76 family)
VTGETWAARAAETFASFDARYWLEGEGLYLIRSPLEPRDNDLPFDPFHYWWQAHALDALVDAYTRDGNAAHLERAGQLLEGIVRKNGSLTNDFYDDMQWLALSTLRAWDASGDARFKDACLALWADIKLGWNDHCGGGIAWRKPQLDYKNTPANAPAAILAARLHTRFGDAADLEWARRIFDWLEAHLIDPQTGFAWDGMNRQGDGGVDKDWAFTYCQGVTVGAAVELHAATREGRYLEAARRTARAAHARLAQPATHAMPDEGDGDGGLFKGILVRYLTQYALLTLDENVRRWLEANAVLAWAHRAQGLNGRDWTHAPAFPLDLSTALSGVMLTESMAVLERVGALPALENSRSAA